MCWYCTEASIGLRKKITSILTDFFSGTTDFVSGMTDFFSGTTDFVSAMTDFFSGITDFVIVDCPNQSGTEKISHRTVQISRGLSKSVIGLSKSVGDCQNQCKNCSLFFLHVL